MTQVLSVSATTAAYAMEAAKPARRVATKDQVKDVKHDAEVNEARASGASAPEANRVAPPSPLKLDLGIAGDTGYPASFKEVKAAYEETS